MSFTASSSVTIPGPEKQNINSTQQSGRMFCRREIDRIYLLCLSQLSSLTFKYRYAVTGCHCINVAVYS